jgi:hypothetical protein
MRRGIRLFVLATALAAVLAAAPSAQATFHLIKVREVYAGSANDSYVELQMFAAGQSFLTNHAMTVYNSSGTLVHSSKFTSGIANSANQSTVLIGDTGVQAKFGLAPDLLDAELAIPAAGGAACWNAGGLPADCVAWGNFSGGAALKTATGTEGGSPVSPGGITAGKAIRRTIEPGCPTLLEESDDSDNSAADFAEVTPAPRNNASAITEKTCAGAPNTAIDEKPALVTSATAAEFTYEAPTATSYQCKLDAAAFSSCLATGVEYTGLAEGSHTFQVRGVNASGPDTTPASYAWRVDTTPATTTIDTHPADPSPGKAASFTFHAGESGVSFECSLSQGAAADSFSACTSGKTYGPLADGEYTFKVRASDQAANEQLSPTVFTWTVDNSLADTTPPETKIDSFPADPSSSSTASFTYESNEAGSSFECSLDGAVFAPCAATGSTYSGLSDGPHSFQVRAVDAEANIDPTPAGYSFSVVAGPPASSPPGVSNPPPAPGAGPSTPSPPPKLVFVKKPPAKSKDRTPTFRFRSDQAGASFQCALDRGPFRACRSPFTPTKPLTFGPHKLQVRIATSPGVVLSFRFRIVRGR